MKWIAEHLVKEPLALVIKNEGQAGFSLRVYLGEFCLFDDLQDASEFSKNRAKDLFGISQKNWARQDDKTERTYLPVSTKIRFEIEGKRDGAVLDIKVSGKDIYKSATKSFDSLCAFAAEKLNISRSVWKETE